jgi:hypothetical protein
MACRGRNLIKFSPQVSLPLGSVRGLHGRAPGPPGGDTLGISIHTVKDYGKSIRVKYNVKTRVQLISALLGRALQTSR